MEINKRLYTQTNIEVLLDPEELEQIIIDHVAKKAGVDLSDCDDITVFLDNKIREAGPCVLFETSKRIENVDND